MGIHLLWRVENTQLKVSYILSWNLAVYRPFSITGRNECSEDSLDDRKESLKFIISLDVSSAKKEQTLVFYDNRGLNPRTYRQIHTPTVVQGVGRGWMEPLSRVFDVLCYFTFSWKAFDLLNKMKYILGVVAQLHQQWSPSWILPRSRN